jgi:hypothetical protein
MTKDARVFSGVKILCLSALLNLAGFDDPAAAAVGAPVLKWEKGGCFSSWCETGWYSSPAVADLDGDGNMEVVASAYSIVVLDGATGTLKWRVNSGHDRQKPNADNVGRTWPGIVIADLDHDGELEIVTAHSGGWVSVLNRDGYFKSKKWPWRAPGGRELRSLSVGDLDRDGDLEIIVGRAAGSGTNTWVLEHTGAVRWGWPRLKSGDKSSAWGTYNANIGLGDLDGDGLPEIIVPSDTITVSAYRSDGTQLATNFMYHGHSGHDMNFWGEVPAYVDLAFETRGWGPCYEEFTPRANFAMGPANVVDVNGDGVKEVVVIGNVHDCHTSPYTDLYNTPYIFNGDRSRFNSGGFDWTTVPTNTGAPLSEDWSLIESAQPNPVTVDLDGDGNAEILYASYDGKVHCIRLDKTEKWNWPYSVYNEAEGIHRFGSEPVVADLDNDGYAEVIFTSWTQKGSHATGKLHILDYMGNLLHAVNLPQAFGSDNWNGALAAPTLADIDGDGELEVVVNTAHSGVVAYDLPGTSNARVLWGTGRGSYLREGGNGELPSVVTGPDLTPSWNRLTITGPNKKGRYNIHGWIKVSNLGNKASVECLLNVYYPDESQTVLKKPIKVGKLPAGRAVVKEFVLKGISLTTGATSQYIVVADTENSVAEINESNNKAAYIINLP